jgi:hypothetical protein
LGNCGLDTKERALFTGGIRFFVHTNNTRKTTNCNLLWLFFLLSAINGAINGYVYSKPSVSRIISKVTAYLSTPRGGL